MRIVQLIDSLEAGGAERMAVNYANALATTTEFSSLITTRQEGNLKELVTDKVHYLYLCKKNTWDGAAIFTLRRFLKVHRVQIIHAHSSSFFMAVLMKIFIPNLKIIWHDHYGNSEYLNTRSKKALQLAAFFFNGIVAVNEKLRMWSLEQLHFKNGIYLPNFAQLEKPRKIKTFLNGSEGKRIVCLANLRIQKNHFLLLNVAVKLKESHPDWTFHLVGKDFNDAYSNTIKEWIALHHLENTVFLYGTQKEVGAILSQSDIGVLTSVSEGLPVALLEYGLHQKPVVVTRVGQISSVVVDGESGFLVPSEDGAVFYQRLVTLINDEKLRNKLAEHLHQKIEAEFSEKAIIQQYLNWVKTTITNE